MLCEDFQGGHRVLCGAQEWADKGLEAMGTHLELLLM